MHIRIYMTDNYQTVIQRIRQRGIQGRLLFENKVNIHNNDDYSGIGYLQALISLWR